jgi:predicted secreted protein
MGFATGMLVYVVAWWLVFFLALPIGIQSHSEAGEEVEPGTPESAPVRPRLLLKALVASVLAGVIVGIFYLIDVNDLISFRK